MMEKELVEFFTNGTYGFVDRIIEPFGYKLKGIKEDETVVGLTVIGSGGSGIKKMSVDEYKEFVCKVIDELLIDEEVDEK